MRWLCFCFDNVGTCRWQSKESEAASGINVLIQNRFCMQGHSWGGTSGVANLCGKINFLMKKKN
jgi:hypothetical protein